MNKAVAVDKPVAVPAPQPPRCPKCAVKQHAKTTTEMPAPQPKDSCPECQMSMHPDRTMQNTLVHVPALTILGLPAPVLVLDSPHPANGRDVLPLDSSPPILLDLFHISCLLTI